MPRPRLFRRLYGERGGALRPLLLVLVFAAVAMLYWQHMGNRIADIGDTDLHDSGKLLDKDQRRLLRQQRALLRQESGVRLLLRVDAEALHVPTYDAGVVFVGAGLTRQEAVVVFPPLVQRALGEGVRLDLEDSLRQCLRDGTAVTPCFTRAIDTLRAALRAAG